MNRQKFKVIIGFVLLSGLFFNVNAFAQAVHQQSSEHFNKFIFYWDSVFSQGDAKGSVWSFLLSDTSGKSLINFNDHVLLVPASCFKIITTATALEIMSPEYQYTTKLLRTGEIREGHLKGNLLIKGGGDPSLGSSYFNSFPEAFLDSWLNAIKQAGIKEIDGDVISISDVFPWYATPGSWQWEDLGSYYGSAPSGLSVFDNIFNLELEPYFLNGQMKWRVQNLEPEIPGLQFHYDIQLSHQKTYLDVLGAPYSPVRLIQGHVMIDQKKVKLKASIPDPPFLLAHLLRKKLIENQIRVNGVATTDRLLSLQNKNIVEENSETIIDWKSKPLKEIVKITNTESQNLYAEHILLSIPMYMKRTVCRDTALELVQDFWMEKKIWEFAPEIYDGSGLSRKNLVTVHHLVNVLVYMLHSSCSKEFISSLPVSGQNGTLKYYLNHPDLKGDIVAKSGSMTHVKNFAGYIRSKNGHQYVFAFMLNNYSCDSSKLKPLINRFFVQLISLLNDME